MPAVHIENPEHQRRALKVLMEIGGPFQGRGREKRILVVTNDQYEALIRAGVVKRDGARVHLRGKKKHESKSV